MLATYYFQYLGDKVPIKNKEADAQILQATGNENAYNTALTLAQDQDKDVQIYNSNNKQKWITLSPTAPANYTEAISMFARLHHR